MVVHARMKVNTVKLVVVATVIIFVTIDDIPPPLKYTEKL